MSRALPLPLWVAGRLAWVASALAVQAVDTARAWATRTLRRWAR